MQYNDIDETVKAYFTSLNGIKSLSKKEEHELLKKYKEENDLAARDKIITANLKYTCKIAHGYRDKGVDFSSLISEANDALIEAIDKFDAKRDVKIMSYAKWWIMQRLQSVIDKKNKMPLSEIPNAYDDNTVNYEDDMFATKEYFEADKVLTDTMDDENENESRHQFICKITDNLNTREKEMLDMYYGLSSGEECTLEDIGLKFSLTKERVRQILETAFKKIRSASILMDSQYIAR